MTPTKSSLWKHKHPSLDKGSSWSCLRDARQRISSISILFADQAVFVALGCICNIKRNRFWTSKSWFQFIAGLYKWFFNMGFLLRSLSFTLFSIHSCTAAIAYNIDVEHISTHKFFHMMPETDSWRDMSPWVLLVSLNHKKHYTC